MNVTLDKRGGAGLRPSETEAGARRRVGVEIEFAGLSEAQAAKIFAEASGGTVRLADKGYTCETPLFGTCQVYLDTAWRSAIEAVGVLDLARHVVPVEIVTEPFDPRHIPDFDAAIDVLRSGGATGSRGSVVYGFGVHLNVEAASLKLAHVVPVARAFALLEPVLRAEIGLDISRRALPFVSPYPEELVDALTSDLSASMEDFAKLYLRHTTSRNHGLDLLPLLTEAAPEAVVRAVGEGEKIAPRPAWHYRLPESRIDEAGWGIAADWRRWCAIETIARDRECLSALCRAWARYRAGAEARAWADIAQDVLASASGVCAA